MCCSCRSVRPAHSLQGVHPNAWLLVVLSIVYLQLCTLVWVSTTDFTERFDLVSSWHFVLFNLSYIYILENLGLNFHTLMNSNHKIFLSWRNVAMSGMRPVKSGHGADRKQCIKATGLSALLVMQPLPKQP